MGNALEQPIYFTSEEFYGELNKIENLLELKTGSEEICHWPQAISEGFFYVTKLRPGLILTIVDHHAEVPIKIDFTEHGSIFEIIFVLRGRINTKIGDTLHNRYDFSCPHAEAYVSYHPKLTGSAFIPTSYYRFVSITIEPWLLQKFVRPQTQFAEIVKKTKNAPFSLPFFFLESKVLELFLMVTEKLHVLTSSPQRFPLIQQENSFVEEIRTLLLDSMEKHLSLEELAHRAGVNKTKLNTCFKDSYGVTIFEYLRIARLERAKTLLGSGRKGIFDVALEVGYKDHSTFSRQFKKYFGVSPREYIS